jgi:GxxExxY protein
MTENEISYIVRGCIFKVFNNLGPGLLESAYEAALLYEIEKTGLNVKSQVALPMIYETIRVDIGYRLDLLIEGKIVIELKSVETLLVHDGTTAYITIYGSICSNNTADIIELSSNINGVSGNVAVYATGTSANLKVNLVSTYIKT